MLALSTLIPLQHAFFPSGFSCYRLKKLCDLFESVCHIFERVSKDRGEDWNYEISGEKLADFLDRCY